MKEQNGGNVGLYSVQDGGEALDRRLLGQLSVQNSNSPNWV